MTPLQVRQVVDESGLRGLGGAGFPTGKKWSFIPPRSAGNSGARYAVMNADEMEPGAFKDRLLLEGDPHQAIEGLLLAAYAAEATAAYLFLRREYVHAAKLLTDAINAAREAGYIGKNVLGSPWSVTLSLHISAGRYMCGEETGLLNALEGKRPHPAEQAAVPAGVRPVWQTNDHQ